MSTASFTQVTARVRNDDGSEAAATWRQAQGTNDTVSGGVNFRVRFRIDETASVAWTSKVWNLRYSLNGGAYTAVSGSTPVQFSLSSQFVDGADCTTQLTGGTGTFVADNNGMKETTGGATNSGSAGFLFETEWCLKLDTAQVAVGNTIDLRIYDGTSAIAAYTFTPRITVGEWQRTSTDTASAADTSSEDGTASLADTASATETNSGQTAISVSDTASAGDSITTQNVVNVIDTASASDTQSLGGDASKVDTAAAGEAQTLSATATSSADTGTASDTNTAAAGVSLADTAGASDTNDVGGSASLVDAASTTETANSSGVALQADTAAAADALTSAGTATNTDTGSTGEASALDASALLSDTGTASDANTHDEIGSGPSEVTINDTASAGESQVLSADAIIPDAATGTDEFLGHIDFDAVTDSAVASDAASYTIPQIFVAPFYLTVSSGTNKLNVSRGENYLTVATGYNLLNVGEDE